MPEPRLRGAHYSVQNLVAAVLLAGFVLIGLADSLVLARPSWASRGALSVTSLTFHSIGHRAGQSMPNPQVDEDYVEALLAATH